MTVCTIIVAAGRGTRAGGHEPKQWQRLLGRSVLDWTVARFLDMPEMARVVLVLHPDDMDRVAPSDRLTVVAGGATRDASVRAGLTALSGAGCVVVLIHDVARPCVPIPVINDVIKAAKRDGAAAPALPVSDALWRGEGDRVTGTESRDGLFRAQTPQGFRFDLIEKAHSSHPGGAADDVEVARAAGHAVTITQGHEDNLKITYPADFARAEAILRGRQDLDIRLGNGFDVHAFEAGDHVVLCGVRVPHDMGLKGHSDADVGMHALTDAIYGALAEGDIGQHFPPSDPQWKGAESHIFLRHAVTLAKEKGFALSNADVTLICERPKIGPHSEAMRAALADIMALDMERISVKATTSEKLGFTGRGEGIAAIATATLIGGIA